MLKQISILSAIAITVAAVAPGAEAGRMRRPSCGGTTTTCGMPPVVSIPPVVTPPAPRNVTQTNVVNNDNTAINTVAGSTSCNKCSAGTGITAGNQANETKITQTAAGGTVKQSNEVNNTNFTANTVVGNGGIKAGNQSNSTTVIQSAP